MSLLVSHKTSYFYGDPVSMCQNVLHLRPRTCDWQQVLTHELTITPAPIATRDYQDYFGNHVTWINLLEPHHQFVLHATSTINLLPRDIPPLAQSTPWDQLLTIFRTTTDPSAIKALQYTFASPHIATSDDESPLLLEYAMPSFARGRPLLEAVEELTRRIQSDFTFTSGFSDVQTPVGETLRSRRGVCQDFAHLQIALLRQLGLPARYVSGYIVTQPPPGQPRLIGADASHAWVSVFDPAFGWVDFDPTNGTIPQSDHITLGWARDYGDVCPVRGITLGGSSQSLGVAVDVIPQSA